MSHFVVMVIGDDAEKQLEKYDESLELPPYIKHTKDELVALKRKEIEDYRNTVYAKYLENKELYKQGCENERHIEYLENEFPQKLHWSDEQVYQDAIKYSEIDEKGNEIDTSKKLTDVQKTHMNNLLINRKEEILPIINRALELWDSINK